MDESDMSGSVPESLPEESDESFGLSEAELAKRTKITKHSNRCGSLRRKLAVQQEQYDKKYAELLQLTFDCPHRRTGIGPMMIGKTDAQVRFCLVCGSVLPAIGWR